MAGISDGETFALRVGDGETYCWLWSRQEEEEEEEGVGAHSGPHVFEQNSGDVETFPASRRRNVFFRNPATSKRSVEKRFDVNKSRPVETFYRFWVRKSEMQ